MFVFEYEYTTHVWHNKKEKVLSADVTRGFTKILSTSVLSIQSKSETLLRDLHFTHQSKIPCWFLFFSLHILFEDKKTAQLDKQAARSIIHLKDLKVNIKVTQVYFS